MALKRPESVLVVLYDEHHRILVMQRQDDPEFWQSVTGTIEQGEQPVQTAYREVREETGIQLNRLTDHQHINTFVIRNKWRHRYPPGTVYNQEHVFSAQVCSTSAIYLTEHLAYEWLPKSEALCRLWSPSNREAVEAFVPGVK